MKSIRTTAPGKIVILGEFAVLDSASAISMAINKRAIVTIKESAGDSHLVRTIGYKDGNWPFNIDKKRNTADEQIYQIYLSRAEELAEVIFSLIQKSRFRDLTDNNIILTGYGSKSQIFNKIFSLKLNNSNFRVGATLKLNGPKTYIDNPSFTSSCGLLIYVVNHDLEGSNHEKNAKKRTIISTIYNFFRSL